MKGCVFCKIATGEIPCYKIYEDKEFLAFLDINPWVEGHSLIIPKKHYHWVWDMPSDAVGRYFQVVQKIARHYQEVLGTEFVMSFIYGYDIPHAHIHLLPNAKGKVAFYPKEKLGTLSPEKGNELVEKLKLSQ